jgi:hypothetical protein
MKNFLTYNKFVVQSSNGVGPQTLSKRIKIKFDLDNESTGNIDDEIILAMSLDSSGVYQIGNDIEKYCGIPEKEVKEKLHTENEDDAIIYGLCNIANGGKDIYFWTNATRLRGEIKRVGLLPAIIEQVSHEAGVHLTRSILTRAIAKKKKIDFLKWYEFDYGAGPFNWPAVGDNVDKDSIIMIDEETFATASGLICQQLINEFITMSKSFIPGINTL